MSAQRSGRTLALLAALSPWSSACSAPEEQGPALSVAIATDLSRELLNVVSVQTLDAQGAGVIATGWFNVEDGCLQTEDGFRTLGSFGVPKAQLAYARLLVTGYQRQPDRSLKPLVKQRLNGVFGDGITAASVKLSRSCALTPSCPADQTCRVDTGACEMLPTFGDELAALPLIEETCLKLASNDSIGPAVPGPWPDSPACAELCTYGYCGQDGCVWHGTHERRPEDRIANTATSAPVASGKLYASAIAMPVGDTTLRGLGALVHPSLAGRLLRIAIYVQTASTVDLVAFTGDIKTVDRTESEVEVPLGTLRVEALLDVPKRLKYGDPYMVAFQVSDDTQLFTAAAAGPEWLVLPMPYGAFPPQLMRNEKREPLAKFQVYAITTPD